MNKRILILFLILMTGHLPVFSQVLSGRLVTSALGWERQDTIGRSTNHLRGYENIQLNFGIGDIAVQTYMQGSTDFSETMEDDPQLRLFNIFLHWKNIADIAEMKLGRQEVYAGVNYGTIDGALLRFRPFHRIELMGYAGGLTPPSQKPDFFHRIEDNWQIGAQALFFPFENAKVGLSYMNRHRESTPFQSFRYDSQLGLLPATIDYGSRANQYGSLTVAYSDADWWLFARYDYDLNFERTSRLEAAAEYRIIPTLGFSLNLSHRQPMIAYNSYFALLEAEANQEAVIGIDYQIHPMITVLGKMSFVRFEEDNAVQISLGAMNKYSSILYTKDISYDGDLDGFNLHLTYPFLDGMLVPHIGAVYSHYALAENLTKTSTWAAVAGAMVRPLKSVSIDMQGQYIKNRIYKTDMRAFLRINYWFSNFFNTNI